MGRSINPAPGTRKPVQRGLATLSYGQTDITISAVDMLKTSVNVIGPGVSTGFAQGPGWHAYLLNSTTIRFTSGVGGGATVDVRYEVLETH